MAILEQIVPFFLPISLLESAAKAVEAVDLWLEASRWEQKVTF